MAARRTPYDRYCTSDAASAILGPWISQRPGGGVPFWPMTYTGTWPSTNLVRPYPFTRRRPPSPSGWCHGEGNLTRVCLWISNVETKPSALHPAPPRPLSSLSSFFPHCSPLLTNTIVSRSLRTSRSFSDAPSRPTLVHSFN